MEEYVDHLFNVHEFNPTHADNYYNGEREETWSFCALCMAMWKFHLENYNSSSFS